MDVVNRALALTSAMQNAVGAAATNSIWTHIAAYREQIAPQIEGLRRHLGRTRAVGSAPSLQHLQQVRHALDQIRETFNARPHQLGQGDVGGLLRRALRDAVIAHRERADEEWRRIQEAVLNDAPGGLFELYRALPDARERAEKASALRSEIASVAAAPAEIRDMEDFKEAVDTLRILLDELASVALPADVERFLESAIRGEARWRHLTPSVIEWLDEHKVLETLRVRIV